MIAKIIQSIAVSLILHNVLWAQPMAVEVTQTQVQFLTAKAATVEQDQASVLIFAEGLSSEVSSAVVLEVKSGSAKWASIHDKTKPFPPSVVREWKPGKFLIRGKAGQVFYVSLGGGDDDVPTWIEVSIGGVGPPPVDPPPVFSDLAEVSRKAAQQLGDKDTAKRLAAAILDAVDRCEKMCAANQCPTLPGAKAIVVSAIESTLATRQDPFRADWMNGWRRIINDALARLSVTQVKDYLSIMRSVAIGLQKVE